jgi:hypothetical protein
LHLFFFLFFSSFLCSSSSPLVPSHFSSFLFSVSFPRSSFSGLSFSSQFSIFHLIFIPFFRYCFFLFTSLCNLLPLLLLSLFLFLLHFFFFPFSYPALLRPLFIEIFTSCLFSYFPISVPAISHIFCIIWVSAI